MKAAANKVSFQHLCSTMFKVFENVELDMAEYQAMFNGLMSEMNFRFKDDQEENFYTEINSMWVNSPERFESVAKKYIEPYYVDMPAYLPELVFTF